ncbi:MAG: glycoside hydrolase family 68 protein, partial [Halohasta sp.]
MNEDLADREWPRWEPAGPIERTRGTVAPPADRPSTDPAPDYHVWDSWPLRSRDGTIATVDGWRVLIALTAPADVTPGERHDIATHRYFVSRDGRQWVDRGPVFEDALGTRQWAGSALLDGEDCYLFYTAAGDPAVDAVTDTQRLAVAHGGRVVAGGPAVEDGPTIEGPWHHEVLLEPDGTYYETQAQAGAMTYTFRDPWFFEDPATG